MLILIKKTDNKPGSFKPQASNPNRGKPQRKNLGLGIWDFKFGTLNK